MSISEQPQINPGSNATDFQPSTQNPQSIESSGLQTQSANPQQNSSSNTSAEQLYQKANNQQSLSVSTGGYSAGSRVSVFAGEPKSNNSLIAITSVLVILLITVLAIRYYWRKAPAGQATVVEPEVESPEVAAAVVVTPTQKVTPKKKPTAKRKKR